MTDFIKRLSPRAEFIVVLCVGFGEFLLSNLLSILNPLSAHGTLTDASLRGLIQFEIAIACVVALFLYLRGWRLSNLGAPFKRTDPAATIGLILATYFLLVLIWQAAVAIQPTLRAAGETELVGGHLTLGTVVLLCVVNPIFEEALLCGYIVTALKERRGFWFAVNVSVGLRLANHLYQGSMGVLSILPLGLLFTVWYARTNRLWPVILAHAAFDLIALWPHIGAAE